MRIFFANGGVWARNRGYLPSHYVRYVERFTKRAADEAMERARAALPPHFPEVVKRAKAHEAGAQAAAAAAKLVLAGEVDEQEEEGGQQQNEAKQEAGTGASPSAFFSVSTHALKP